MTTAVAPHETTAVIKAELDVADVIAQVKKIQQVMSTVMHKGEHFGIIPGTQKPTLLQPGAQKLCLTFRLDPQDEVIQATETDELIAFTVRTTLYHIPSGERIASGIGSCNSRERKYVRRDRDGSIQPAWDVHNTILKMASKRALIAAVLRGTAASDIFTQDVEDLPEDMLRQRPRQAEQRPQQQTAAAPVEAVPMITLAQQKALRLTGEQRGLTKDDIVVRSQGRFGAGVKELTAEQGAALLAEIQSIPEPDEGDEE